MKLFAARLAFPVQQTTYAALWLANVALVVAVLLTGSDRLGNDRDTYVGLADGVLAGRYSYWQMLPDPPPDTFRSPGYPLFLAFFRFFSRDTVLHLQIAQGLLHLGTLCLVLRCARSLSPDPRLANILLALYASALYLLAHVPMLYPETAMTFIVAVLLWCEMCWTQPSWLRDVLRGVAWGYGALLRSPYVLLGPAWVIVAVLRRKPLCGALLSLGTSVLCMMPYGLWNLRAHGEFRLTPLESGAPVFHAAFWQYLLPGYTEHRYWRNHFYPDLASLPFVPGLQQNICRFEADWDRIDARCVTSLTAADQARIPAMQAHPELFPTYSSQYTRCRARAIWEAYFQSLRERPFYFLFNRAYAVPRLLYTGVDLARFREATSFSARVMVAGPFLLTAGTLVLVAWSLVWTFRFRRDLFRELEPALMLAAFGWLVHAGVVTQARYTLPIRPLLLLVIAFVLYARRFEAALKQVPASVAGPEVLDNPSEPSQAALK